MLKRPSFPGTSHFFSWENRSFFNHGIQSMLMYNHQIHPNPSTQSCFCLRVLDLDPSRGSSTMTVSLGAIFWAMHREDLRKPGPEIPSCRWAKDIWGLENQNLDSHIILHGYGSIPIDTIFSGMNIHKSQLFWVNRRVPGFWPIPTLHPNIWKTPHSSTS